MSTNSVQSNVRKLRRPMGAILKGEPNARAERRLNKLARRARHIKELHGVK